MALAKVSETITLHARRHLLPGVIPVHCVLCDGQLLPPGPARVENHVGQRALRYDYRPCLWRLRGRRLRLGRQSHSPQLHPHGPDLDRPDQARLHR